MRTDLPSFVAHATHPSFGDETTDGRIMVDQWHFHFKAEGAHLQVPLARLEVALGEEAGSGVFFSDPDQPDWSVYTYDQRILQDLHLTGNSNTRVQIKSFGTRGELRRRVKATLWVLGSILCLVLGINIFSSLAVRLLVSKVTPQFEQEMGSNWLVELHDEETFITNALLQAEINKAAAPLLSVLPTNGIPFQFSIVDDHEPNAFSLPGGYIVFTTGLLEMLDKNRPEQLTGVMAHEIAHITEKHVFREVISSFGPLLLMELMLASDHSRLGSVSAASSLLIVQSFSQEYEFEADTVGWKSLVLARVNPHGMIEMLSKLRAYEDQQKELALIPGAFRSHPATDKRIRKLESKWKRIKDKSHFVNFSSPEAI